ncbi:MAG TPA: rod shape-determining protein MreD, partial [Dysgonamonadaceae bacterium]|nr:rod shape-determining protein MreD [Dysgonamonadaceae bacterium]
MKTTFLREMAGFVVLVLLQTLVLNRISVFGVAVPILYIYFLIKLPKNRNLFYVVISGFLMGLI